MLQFFLDRNYSIRSSEILTTMGKGQMEEHKEAVLLILIPAELKNKILRQKLGRQLMKILIVVQLSVSAVLLYQFETDLYLVVPGNYNSMEIS